ncbi:MAG: putative quinol monooxygenase [Chitinophagales bacterium]
MIRVVKLTFKEEFCNDFIEFISKHQEEIRGKSGCQSLEFLRDRGNPCIFFTYSLWSEESDLESYRESELFQTVWAQVKTWFDSKPEAWSLNSLEF